MIHILVGSNTTGRASEYKKAVGNREVVSMTGAAVTQELLLEYAGSSSLFGETPAIVIDGGIKENKALFSVDMLKHMQGSPTIFILLEDKLLAADQKKYGKYATISVFEEKKVAQVPKVNTFAIADAFGRRDKVQAWVLYNDAIENGIEPEAISGIIFWKIKNLVQTGSRIFSLSELRYMSGELVALYHKAHRGEADFTIGLEQFILARLSAPNTETSKTAR